jgi:hypothetical protein
MLTLIVRSQKPSSAFINGNGETGAIIVLVAAYFPYSDKSRGFLLD